MKTIEEVILENSLEQKAKLYKPAKIAFDNPETGVSITNKSAYRVIKDCAETTLLFLPLEIFLKYKNPISSLKGKFNRENVTDLFNRSKNDLVSRALFNSILDTCPRSTLAIPTKSAVHNNNTDDPYGEYSSDTQNDQVDNRSQVDIILSSYE